ncbi:uncharacterized protein LOC141657133 [Silene latifolia]|uniref:uncharacterized protein LOC141657133 n=1 Tax=Silene latifolia TaxID=37657 RepID=UPI003D7856F2
MAEKYSITSDYINNQWQKWCNKRFGSIVSVKKREDVKKVEEVEDCFILEFDPNDLTHLHNGDNDDNDDDNGDDCSEISGSIVCVKKREDVKKFEEVEDCFILDFDPFLDVDSIGFKFDKLSVSVKTEVCSDDNDDNNDDDDDDEDDDVSILGIKGKVACRDYPHPRHLCGTHPFKKTSHEIHCKMCYCYVCDTSAPCKKWTKGCKDPSLKHCDATPDIPLWRRRRDRKKQRSKEG